jgi:predicted amidohydrolase
VNTALGQQGVTAGPVDTVVVACCQLAPTLGDPGANRERVADAVCHAVSLGARIVVLPELVSSGYVFEDRAEAAASAEPTDGETLTLWVRLAADHQIVIVGGFCEQAASGEVFNSAALIDPGGLRSAYRKAHLWDAENLLFSPGSTPRPVVSTAYGRIGMLICYDLEIPEWVRIPAMDGAQLLLNHHRRVPTRRRTRQGHQPQQQRPCRPASRTVRPPDPDQRSRNRHLTVRVIRL